LIRKLLRPRAALVENTCEQLEKEFTDKPLLSATGSIKAIRRVPHRSLLFKILADEAG